MSRYAVLLVRPFRDGTTFKTEIKRLAGTGVVTKTPPQFCATFITIPVLKSTLLQRVFFRSLRYWTTTRSEFVSERDQSWTLLFTFWLSSADRRTRNQMRSKAPNRAKQLLFTLKIQYSSSESIMLWDSPMFFCGALSTRYKFLDNIYIRWVDRYIDLCRKKYYCLRNAEGGESG